MVNIFVFIFVLICFFDIQLSFEEKGLPKPKGIVKASHEWREGGECHERTFPIRRFMEVKLEYIKKINGGAIRKNISNAYAHEYAAVITDPGTYYGTRFATSVWNPHVENNEISIAQTWIQAGQGNTINTIEVGWMVYPKLYGDSKTHLFIFATNDGYNTISYNENCTGFHQLSERIKPGDELSLISQYGSQSEDIWLSVYKLSEKWWFQVGDEVVGYWPASIFPLLSSSANSITWGGEVVDKKNDNHHTTTQMGSGHFANEKYSKAALFYYLEVQTKDDDDYERPGVIHPLVSNHNCYSLLKAEYDENFGDHFFYGGPGYSESCL